MERFTEPRSSAKNALPDTETLLTDGPPQMNAIGKNAPLAPNGPVDEDT